MVDPPRSPLTSMDHHLMGADGQPRVGMAPVPGEDQKDLPKRMAGMGGYSEEAAPTPPPPPRRQRSAPSQGFAFTCPALKGELLSSKLGRARAGFLQGAAGRGMNRAGRGPRGWGVWQELQGQGKDSTFWQHLGIPPTHGEGAGGHILIQSV